MTQNTEAFEINVISFWKKSCYGNVFTFVLVTSRDDLFLGDRGEPPLCPPWLRSKLPALPTSGGKRAQWDDSVSTQNKAIYHLKFPWNLAAPDVTDTDGFYVAIPSQQEHLTRITRKSVPPSFCPGRSRIPRRIAIA